MKPEDLPKPQLEQLKEAAKIFLRPMERLPFPVVIEAMTGHRVLPVMKNPQDESLLEMLFAACIETVAASAGAAIHANRPNDVSTQVEERLEARLKSKGIRVEKPQAPEVQTPGGYPDRLIWCENQPTYLEVKVSRERTLTRDQRATSSTNRRHGRKFDTPHVIFLPDSRSRRCRRRRGFSRGGKS